jgi:hypothetical protein
VVHLMHRASGAGICRPRWGDPPKGTHRRPFSSNRWFGAPNVTYLTFTIAIMPIIMCRGLSGMS